MLIFQNK